MYGINNFNLKNIYKNETTDNIFIYFMKTILDIEKNGIATLPLENNFEEPLKGFIHTAINLLIDGQPPEISSLVLSSEYNLIAKNTCKGEFDIHTAVNLELIKEISQHIHYDSDYYMYIISLCNLWGNKVHEYAAKIFYPGMPGHLKDKYGINSLLKYMEPGMFQPGGL